MVSGAQDQTPLGAQNSLFRRGLILGLTLAEISLLIVFVLLLVFGGLLKKAEGDLERQRALQREALAAREQLRRVVGDYAPAANGQQIEQWVNELISSSVRQAENAELKSELASATEALDRVAAASEKAGLTDAPSTKENPAKWQAVVEAIEASVDRVKAAEIAARQVGSGAKGDVARETYETSLENEQLRGALANAQRRLEAAGKGTEKPACWATREGRPEYIFEITLLSGGIRIHDRRLPHRQAQQAILPTSPIHFDQVLSANAFRTQTRPLFDWGEQRGCRFFVVAVDGTGPAEKSAFKQRLREMEEHFYKYLSN